MHLSTDHHLLPHHHTSSSHICSPARLLYIFSSLSSLASSVYLLLSVTGAASYTWALLMLAVCVYVLVLHKKLTGESVRLECFDCLRESQLSLSPGLNSDDGHSLGLLRAQCSLVLSTGHSVGVIYFPVTQNS